jgi:hypothetical protein
MGPELRRSLDIAGHSFGTDYRSGKTQLLRALTPVEIAHADGTRMIGCIFQKFARDNFARGNFCRIIDSKVSHFSNP